MFITFDSCNYNIFNVDIRVQRKKIHQNIPTSSVEEKSLRKPHVAARLLQLEFFEENWYFFLIWLFNVKIFSAPVHRQRIWYPFPIACTNVKVVAYTERGHEAQWTLNDCKKEKYQFSSQNLSCPQFFTLFHTIWSQFGVNWCKIKREISRTDLLTWKPPSGRLLIKTI